ncbi:uncharacterized protein LOC144881261 [Branchiostoma floridae x Branchiostoma japonicum]
METAKSTVMDDSADLGPTARVELCRKKNRHCSKPKGHVGLCKKMRPTEERNQFWRHSPYTGPGPVAEENNNQSSQPDVLCEPSAPIAQPAPEVLCSQISDVDTSVMEMDQCCEEPTNVGSSMPPSVSSQREVFPFWEYSDSMKIKRKRDSEQLLGKKEELEAEVSRLEAEVRRLGEEECRLETVVGRLRQEAAGWQEKAVELVKQQEQVRQEWEKLRTREEEVEAKYREVREMDDKIGKHPKARNPTTMKMMEEKCTTWYRRKNQAKDCLLSINGGEEGALVAAFGVLVDLGSFEQIDKLMISYKKGKFWQLKFNSVTKKYEASDENLEKSLAAKINAQLSRRNYQFTCKTLISVYDPTKKVYIPRGSYIDGVEFRQPKLVSNSKLQEKINSIDIGHIHPVPGYVGVTRTLVSLVFMIVDLHLSVPHLRDQLRWFNGKKNHFIFFFADDGTPETKESTMSVGTLSCWNFNSQVRSDRRQYFLHAVGESEKAAVFKHLWEQAVLQMEMMESKPYTIAGELCTFEFRAGGDESWAATALGETSGSATYPSPWADVTKANMFTVGGKIGETWMPWTIERRLADLQKLDEYMNSLPSVLSESARRLKRNAFMAKNKMRQLCSPPIGKYCSTFCPDCFHTEVNAFQQFLNTLYHEARRRGCVKHFTDVLAAPIFLPKAKNGSAQGTSQGKNHILVFHEAAGDRVRCNEDITAQSDNLRDNLIRRLESSQVEADQGECSPPLLGLNMKATAARILEHDANASSRNTKLSSFRLIGEHAITLARYSYRLVDALEVPNEDEVSKVKRYALGKVAEHLRDAGAIFNKVNTDEAELKRLESHLDIYYNLHCLFLPESDRCLTVWTMGKALPYSARQLFERYGAGYGVVSMQGKEAKNARLKKDLKLTNRSKEGEHNKFYQLFRMEYMRDFYLEEYSPSPSRYNPHFTSRVPSHVGTPGICHCGREIGEDQLALEDPELQVSLCTFCVNALEVVACAKEGELTPKMAALLKRDKFGKELSINPSTMKKDELVLELKRRNLGVSGSVGQLRNRLEEALEDE